MKEPGLTQPASMADWQRLVQTSGADGLHLLEMSLLARVDVLEELLQLGLTEANVAALLAGFHEVTLLVVDEKARRGLPLLHRQLHAQ